MVFFETVLGSEHLAKASKYGSTTFIFEESLYDTTKYQD